MQTKISLEGEWKLQLDEGNQGLALPFTDVITLPGTTSYARKGSKNEDVLVSALTDEYLFEGQVWYSKEVVIPEELAGKVCFLYLERTRLTTLWLDNQEIGVLQQSEHPTYIRVAAASTWESYAHHPCGQYWLPNQRWTFNVAGYPDQLEWDYRTYGASVLW